MQKLKGVVLHYPLVCVSDGWCRGIYKYLETLVILHIPLLIQSCLDQDGRLGRLCPWAGGQSWTLENDPFCQVDRRVLSSCCV